MAPLLSPVIARAAAWGSHDIARRGEAAGGRVALSGAGGEKKCTKTDFVSKIQTDVITTAHKLNSTRYARCQSRVSVTETPNVVAVSLLFVGSKTV